jgi:hypothetical protein
MITPVEVLAISVLIAVPHISESSYITTTALRLLIAARGTVVVAAHAYQLLHYAVTSCSRVAAQGACTCSPVPAAAVVVV